MTARAHVVQEHVEKLMSQLLESAEGRERTVTARIDRMFSRIKVLRWFFAVAVVLGLAAVGLSALALQSQL
jgi:hypothetical protein